MPSKNKISQHYVPPSLPSVVRPSTISNLYFALRSQHRNIWNFFTVWWKYKNQPDFPLVIQLQTVNRCNANCKMCPYGSTTATGALLHMSDQLYDQLIAELAAEKSFRMLVLSFQNDPLVDKKLVARVSQRYFQGGF